MDIDRETLDPNQLANFAMNLKPGTLCNYTTGVDHIQQIKPTKDNIGNDKISIKQIEHWICPKCKVVFETRGKFEYHKRMHKERVFKRFSCSICAKLFPTKQSLQVHSIVHTQPQDRPFSCKTCSKTFQTKQNLQNHMNIHLDIKPFKCKKCNLSFREQSTLTKHLSTHTKEKHHSCSTCNMKFSQASSLQRHVTKFHQNFDNFSGFLPALGAEIVANQLMLLENKLEP
ncbi:uncharacterized protein LOC100185683 [Ciona intestinalis]